MLTTRIPFVLLLISTILTGCSTHATKVSENLISPGARVGYVSRTFDQSGAIYCPEQASSCEFFPIDQKTLDDFILSQKLEIVLLEQTKFNDNVGANIGSSIGKLALGTINQGVAIGLSQNSWYTAPTLESKLAVYKKGDTDLYNCNDLQQCRTEAKRIMTKASPGILGEQISIATKTRLNELKTAIAKREKVQSIAKAKKEIDYHKMVLKNIGDNPTSPESVRMKKESALNLKEYEKLLAKEEGETVAERKPVATQN